MRIQELVAHWEKASKGERTRQQFSINLPLKEAAQVLVQALLLQKPMRVVDTLEQKLRLGQTCDRCHQSKERHAVRTTRVRSDYGKRS